MSAWKDFLKLLERLRGVEEPKPGAVMFNFINRYLEPMEDIKYRVEFDGKVVSGITTKEKNVVEVNPLSLHPIKLYAWSRVRKEFKLIDEVPPVLGKRLLINERMKTFKHGSETQPHPIAQPASVPAPAQPVKPKPAAVPKKESNPERQAQGVEPVKTKNADAEPEHHTNRSITEKITVPQLKKIFPAADEAYLAKVADEFNTDLLKYKLDTPLRRAHFFAQVRQEAGSGLNAKQESLNYLSDVLIQKFKYYRLHRDEAATDGRIDKKEMVEKTIKGTKKKVPVTKTLQKANQIAIANKAYGRDSNGPPESGDGWRFRGRGIFQLTFRGNYRQFDSDYTKYWNNKTVDFVQDPDKVCEYPYFIRSAVWFWLFHSLYKLADRGTGDGDVNNITAIINPGMDGAANRRANFHELTYPTFK